KQLPRCGYITSTRIFVYCSRRAVLQKHTTHFLRFHHAFHAETESPRQHRFVPCKRRQTTRRFCLSASESTPSERATKLVGISRTTLARHLRNTVQNQNTHPAQD